MSKVKVTWLRNTRDHRLHYFKYGFMQMAKRGEIEYREVLNHDGHNLVPEPVRNHDHRHTVAINVSEGSRSRVLVLDGQDSIFQTTELIKYCDVYFSCAFNRSFFEGSTFDLRLPWQTDCEVSFYMSWYRDLQQRFRKDLHKARALMPIGPNMEMPENGGLLRRKLGGLRHRLSKLRAPLLDWGPQYKRFEKRWDYLMKLRDLEPVYDIVLKDSLWGWPRHRVALHIELKRLSQSFRVHSELHFREVFDYECGTHPKPLSEDFPIRSGGGVSGNYEEMLAKSRLGVFSTGFHYGCRNIVTLAWFLGIKTLCDPFSFESIYKFNGERNCVHRSGAWSEITPLLERAQTEGIDKRRQRQAEFDSEALPFHSAQYVLRHSI